MGGGLIMQANQNPSAFIWGTYGRKWNEGYAFIGMCHVFANPLFYDLSHAIFCSAIQKC